MGEIAMKLRTYILFVVLLSLLGLCTVYESMRQTRIRYRLGELQSQEKAAQAELVKLRSDLSRLMTPTRLESLNTSNSLNLVPLTPLPDVELDDPVALGNPSR
jgi:hypothetical protein